jgi:hypothetical protein
MRFLQIVLVLSLIVAAAAQAKASPSRMRHAHDVIRFFEHHRKQASSPTGQRKLFGAVELLDRRIRVLNRQVRTLQSIPADWLSSVNDVGRFFGAGTASWERSCSQQGSEGGWGRWVPSSSGSGAGGWLQFMSGTFYGIIDEAIADARSRGMLVPSSARDWYSPLGQAIAGAQMLLDGRRGEWSGYAC